MNDPFMFLDVLFGYHQAIGTVIGTFTLPPSYLPRTLPDRGMYCFCRSRIVSDYRIAEAAAEIRTERSRLPSFLPDDNAYGISLSRSLTILGGGGGGGGGNSKRTL